MHADDPKPFQHPATIAAAALGASRPEGGGVVPILNPATTYEKGNAHMYYRNGGPGLADAEAVLNTLEGGAAALLFSSGMAAATHLLLALGPGAHILAPEGMYWFMRDWLKKTAPAMGLDVSFYTNTDLDAMRSAIRPGKTKAVWVETPANPDWAVTDIAAAAEIAHAAGAKLFVDSTCATPILSRPLTLGADVVMHSATKYLNGHSDVLAGALITRDADDFWDQVHAMRTGLGATLGAFEAWLLLRGLRTLDVRMQRHSENARWLASRLSDHPRISHVMYPGLPGDPGHAVARKQMCGGFGGMMSIRVKGGPDAAAQTAKRTKLFFDATSLGGVESLIEHRGPIEGPDSPTPQDLLRLSVGLENAQDLLDDLDQALGQ